MFTSHEPLGVLLTGLAFGGLGVSLGAASLLGLLAVTSRPGALQHPIRRRIYDHLLALPGDHFRSIVRSLQIGLGAARHHLDVLSEEGWVRPERSLGRVRYYAKGDGHDVIQMNRLYERHWVLRDLRVRVLFAVTRLGEARAVDVARSLGISRQLATYHLSRLVETTHLRRSGGAYRPGTRAGDLIRATR